MQALTDDFYVAGQIEPQHITQAKELGISLIINNRPDDEPGVVMTAAEAAQLADEAGIEYLHLPMANGQPLPADLLPRMQEALQKQTDAGSKTLAHCRSGTRSSFLWGAIQIMQGNLSAQEVIDTGAKAGINLVGMMPFLQHLEAERS